MSTMSAGQSPGLDTSWSTVSSKGPGYSTPAVSRQVSTTTNTVLGSTHASTVASSRARQLSGVVSDNRWMSTSMPSPATSSTEAMSRPGSATSSWYHTSAPASSLVAQA